MSRGLIVVALIGAAMVAACGRDRAEAPPARPTRILLPPALAAMPPPQGAPIDPGYVGPEVCGECHADKLDGARATSHFRTSRPATRDATAAPFGEDVMITAAGDPELRVVQLARDDGLWQVGLDRRSGERASRRADVVIGSGKLGQTFLYWEGPFLYELPATYFAPPVGWRFSPGYAEDVLDFSRPVFAQCLECHALWAQPGRRDLVFDHSYVGAVQWGVTCEKCHGPGRDHVAHHRAHPDDDDAHAIVAPGELSRERRDDICMLCHSEHGTELQPAFSFRPGDELRAFYAAAPPTAHSPTGVHSNNQMDRLRLSACYQGSDELSCITCHDPHRDERGDVATFNARCLACHPRATLPAQDHDGAAACAGCHMPKRTTEIARRQGADDEARAMIHDHKIGTY